jgi:hypothetical protein
MKELDRCLAEFEAEYKGPIGDASLRPHECDFTLAITELMPVNGPAKDLQRVKDVWSLCEQMENTCLHPAK